MARRALIVVGLLAAACGSAATTLPTPTSSPSPSGTIAPAKASPSATPTPPPGPERVFGVDPQAAPPPVEIWATTWSGVVRHWSAGTLTEIPFDCREAREIVADARGALVTCDDAYPDGTVYRVTDAGARRLEPSLGSGIPVAVSPDGGEMVVWRRGPCRSPAPVCEFRYTLRDVATGSERVMLPDGYYLGATIGWTALGLTYVQPECADAGCSGIGDKGGTFVWNGTRFERVSEMRFVGMAGAYRVYERGRASSRRDAVVVLEGPGGQRQLTPAGRNERALSVYMDGGVLAVATAASDSQLVRYDAGGTVLWSSEIRANGTVAIGDRYVIVPTYGGPSPSFQVYDVERMVRHDVPLTGARVWTASPRP